MFIVQAPGEWYLRGTTFAGSIERATRFPTIEVAQAAIDFAAKFSRPKIVKTWRIVPAPDAKAEG